MATAHKIIKPHATRKNFTMPDETGRELDFLATLLHKKQSQLYRLATTNWQMPLP